MNNAVQSQIHSTCIVTQSYFIWVGLRWDFFLSNLSSRLHYFHKFISHLSAMLRCNPCTFCYSSYLETQACVERTHTLTTHRLSPAVMFLSFLLHTRSYLGFVLHHGSYLTAWDAALYLPGLWLNQRKDGSTSNLITISWGSVESSRTSKEKKMWRSERL